MKLIKAVVERPFRFRRYRADGTPTETVVCVTAESEEAARLNLGTEIADKPYDWRLDAVLEDDSDAYL